MDKHSEALINGDIRGGVRSQWGWGCKKCGAYEDGLHNRPAARKAWDKHKDECPGEPPEQLPAEVPPPPGISEQLAIAEEDNVLQGAQEAVEASEEASVPEPPQEPEEAAEAVPDGPTGPSDESEEPEGVNGPEADEPAPVSMQALIDRVPCFGQYDADVPECEVCCINEACAGQRVNNE
jgi:hypothetical protein